MEYIKGFTFGWMCNKGDFLKPEAKDSLKLLQERTGSTYVIFALAALQEQPQSTVIDYTGDHMVNDDELIEMIRYAQSLGLKTIMKPTVNVADGTWRAHINFFDLDVPCEPKWRDWFASYTAYQQHYATIAEATGCELFIAGCEMVQTERRADEWRQVIAAVRENYSGLVTYNTDKYQEGHVTWWDAVDVISSSGYYPIDDWDNQLDRIEKIIKPYNKPFFFAEAGCPSRSGSSFVPNNWDLIGDINLAEQEEFYQEMFEKSNRRDWIRGFGLWDWSHFLYEENTAAQNDGYDVYGKPAEKVIREFYQNFN
ncbi:glycoside hydrolase family 113 [Paenibacillus antarcticus]|uniref:1,4-beta-xylanase n=1 Tax=Paenibacillus antarcticus TaxID=253703 RepID=A0A168PVL0_9BACL|nr:1,4-beta-xylanase [Paenibacillus antarcticus]OAB47116.1 1,4-beta-xylanase [Paenibacillus antarcticus]